MSVREVYEVIERECCIGYRLTDREYGFPLIRFEDIKEVEEGIYVCRFRVPWEGYRYGLEKVAYEVGKELGCKVNLFHKDAEENGIFYLECCYVFSLRQDNE